MAIISKQEGKKKKYRFKVGYKDVFGNSKRKCSKWYDSKSECAEAEKMFITQQSKTYIGIKFEEMARAYIEYSSQNNTSKTQSEKLSYLRLYLFDINNKSLSDITPQMIRYALENNTKFMELGTSRKNRILGFVKSVFDHAVKFYGLDKNPVNVMDRYSKSEEEKMKVMNFYTIQQFSQFMAAFDGTKHEEYRSMFYVLYWTGMRLNEANSITFNDISPKSINLYRQYKDGKWVSLKTPKSVRKIAIDRDIYNVIMEMYQYYKTMPKFNNDWFVFGGYRQLPQQSITRISKEYMLKAGLPVIRIHDFRHSHASNLIESGVNIYKISRRLGHSSIAITLDRYGHLIDEEGDEILNAIKDKNMIQKGIKS